MCAVPDSALITNLFIGRYKAQIVRLAIELDIFSSLGDGAQDVASLAGRSGCHPAGLRLLLDYLSSLGLVTRGEDGYTLSATGAFYFVPGRSSYLKEWLLSETDPHIWQRIARAVQDGHPAHNPLPFASEAWMSIYVQGQLANILETWGTAGIDPQRLRGGRILDLASGCGVKTLALALTDPSLHVTLVDSAEVLAAAEYVIDKFNLAGQARLLAGDALTTPLGSQAFELIFVGQITYYWTEAQNRALFQRLHEALVPGGLLVLENMMPDNQDSESRALYGFLLWANVGAALHSFEQYQAWLLAAGFTGIRRPSELLILAEKS
ncbi:MAG TPA: class I SAM-dependent methyltransferase [Anaerolineales bacterium]|nr:class I SAM-dependent methyltransferase [Anaerolineales bacterium]